MSQRRSCWCQLPLPLAAGASSCQWPARSPSDEESLQVTSPRLGISLASATHAQSPRAARAAGRGAHGIELAWAIHHNMQNASGHELGVERLIIVRRGHGCRLLLALFKEPSTHSGCGGALSLTPDRDVCRTRSQPAGHHVTCADVKLSLSALAPVSDTALLLPRRPRVSIVALSRALPVFDYFCTAAG